MSAQLRPHRFYSSETKEEVKTTDAELSEAEKKLTVEIESITNKITELTEKNEELLVTGRCATVISLRRNQCKYTK